MARRNKQPHGWVYFIWVVNLIVLLGLFAFAAFYLGNQNAQASNSPVKSTATPTRYIPPTSYYLPTLTPNPFYTPYVFETSTPFVLEFGPRPNIIGYSAGGHPIEEYTFGVGERQYLIVAGIHGGSEWNTIALANELITYINAYPEVIPSDVKLHIIRNMNPDGESRAHGADGRVNNNGVDLNRNFPTDNWVPNWNHDNCWNDRPTTGGAYGGSEPETKTVMSFISTHRITAMISYHSAALGVFPGGVPWEEPSKKLARALSRVTGYPYPPLEIGCKYTGTLADWAVENKVKAAVDMELANHRDTDFDENLKALKVLLNWQP